MALYKLSIHNLLEPDEGDKIPISNKTEGAEDILIQAIQANKRYEKWYAYKQLPQVMQIAANLGKSNDFGSIDFARNIFIYQVEKLNIPERQADGQFDPPLIEDFAKKNGINLANVYAFWKNKLKGNWMQNRWAGRRLVKDRKEGVYQFPVKSAQIVGDFTGRKPSDQHHPTGHWGTDFGNTPRGTPIFPIAPGTVIAAGDFGKGGQGLKIDHENGVESYYAHNDKVNVSQGDKVDFNTVIASMGASGNARGSIHLHLEVKVGGAKINPVNIIGTSIRNIK